MKKIILLILALFAALGIISLTEEKPQPAPVGATIEVVEVIEEKETVEPLPAAGEEYLGVF